MIPRINMSQTGLNIYRLMGERNMTVKDLQKTLDFNHPGAIYKWINGKTLPCIDNLVVIADVLQVKIEQILSLEKE